MSDLKDEIDELIEAESRVKRINVLSHAHADFAHWSKMAYWSHDEAVALFLSKDPEVINWGELENEVWDIPVTFLLNYSRMRNLVLRAFEMKEIAMQNTPVVFLEWAEKIGIDVPEGLKQQVAARKNRCSPVDSETENLLKIKDEEIASLQKRIDELEILVWEGFDENINTYSKELAIAVKAHGTISKNWKKGMSVKQQITAWLEENYPKLMNEEKERIAKICNWQKSGGAPCTP